ncbi:hypothetical protein ACTFIR_004508 [Dictyostelium discoideum]
MTDIEGHSHCKLFKIKCVYGDKQQIRHLNGDCINADTPVGPFGRNVNSPSFIIETCISQSLPIGVEKIRKYFLCPNIMVTLLLKIFGRRTDGTYVGLAILHRRVVTEVQCTSIVSFGSHPTTHAFVINPNFFKLKIYY